MIDAHGIEMTSLSAFAAEWLPHKILEVVSLGSNRADLIPLWFGESDIPTSPLICDAAVASLLAGNTFYPPRRGRLDLRQSIADYTNQLRGKKISIDDVTVTTGGISALMLSMQMLIRHGDNVVAITPNWPNALETIEIAGGKLKRVCIEFVQGRHMIDLQKVNDAVDIKTKAILINSPNNPTGWIITPEEQASLLQLCRTRGLWLISDEVYDRIIYTGKAAPSFLSLREEDDRLIVINSFSKTWGMTGWRIGWMVAPREFGRRLENLIDYNSSGVPSFLQDGAIAALENVDDLALAMIRYCDQGRGIIGRGLADIPRVQVSPINATFYAYFCIDGVHNSLDFAKELVVETGVGIAPGTAFGGDEGWFRICFAKSPILLKEAVIRLERFLR